MLITIIIALAAVAEAGGDGPLAKAKADFVQCYEPDDVAKTCRSIAGYRENGDGTWANKSTILIDPSKPVSLETTTNVTVEDGAVCGYLRNDELLAGKIRVSGQLLPDAQSAPILAKIATAMAPLVGTKLCTRYVDTPDGLVAKGSAAGLSVKVPDQRVRWVKADEGYSVAPSAGPARPQ